ncbi:MAG: HAD-IIIC family phosphatase [Blastocatellia bacterium]
MTTIQHAAQQAHSEVEKKTIKLLVWDLDNTVWQGTLLEGDNVRLRDGVLETLETLDKRGILHSIASKNNLEPVMEKLKEIGIEKYFLYPQVNWSSKAANIRTIATSINIGLDAVAFIDDEPFEKEEVKHSIPEALILGALELEGLVERPEFNPPFITDESAQRREMYRADIERKIEEEQFVGPSEGFLAGLEMVFTIAPAQEEDLKRAEELTIRTHQLNTTGYTYSFDELNAFRQSPDHLLLIASLDDRFGAYGKIGLTLIEKRHDVWTLKLFLMSCRVMSRGVGTILMNHVLSLARDAGARLRAEFLVNDRNRMMLITYKLGGFRDIEHSGNFTLFEHDLQRIQPHPEWVKVNVE